MSGQGISIGDDGNLYVVTGNGTTSGDNNNMTGGRSESLIKLSPELKMLAHGETRQRGLLSPAQPPTVGKKT